MSDFENIGVCDGMGKKVSKLGCKEIDLCIPNNKETLSIYHYYYLNHKVYFRCCYNEHHTQNMCMIIFDIQPHEGQKHPSEAKNGMKE